MRRGRILVFVLAGRLRERGPVGANGSGLSFVSGREGDPVATRATSIRPFPYG
jgi:hypothetical protein